MARKLILVLTALLLMCAVTLPAENYPYRSDYLFVTVPDHDDWLYETNEEAKIEVEFYKYGIPREGTLTYTIGDDMLGGDEAGTVRLRKGRATINAGTRRTPGFRDIRMKIDIDGKTYEHHIKIGFSADKIKPYTQEPADFMAFWKQNIDDMHKTPLKYTRELAKEYCTDKADCWLVKLDTYRGYTMYGYLSIPKSAKPGSCPAVLCPPGAGIKTIKEPLRHRYYADNGFIRLETEIHGLDPRMPKTAFDDISNAFNGKGTGYLEDGIDNRDRYYMKHVYLGLVRWIDFLASLPEWDGRNMAVQGGSQGGALSLVAASLDSRVTQCVVNHPALADMAAYVEKGRTGGYPHFGKDVLTPQNVKTLQYYDVVNFARHITCPVLMTWGYNDITCPPTTSYAVWNTLTSQKDCLITPVNEHWTSDDTEYGHMLWIKEHLKR